MCAGNKLWIYRFRNGQRGQRSNRDEITVNWHFRGLVILLADLDVDGIAIVT